MGYLGFHRRSRPEQVDHKRNNQSAEIQHPAEDHPILCHTPTGQNLRQGQRRQSMRDALRCLIDTRCPSYRSPSTLNVLLSSAQFEREVNSERIRDKIAVSKRIIASD
jgi:hypothetical protein